MISTSILAPRLIGRHTQIGELEQHLAAAHGGAGRLVLLAGEAGVGKTRLLHEFVAQARAAGGVELLAGRSYDEDPALPYGPFLDVVRMALRGAGESAVTAAAGPLLGELARLLPELAPLGAPALGDDYPQAQKRRLFDAVYRIIRPVAGTSRIVVLEDIHWSDATSQELLRFLAREIAHERVLLLATYRTDELHRRHPLTQLLAYLTRERLHEEIRLDPLNRDEVGELLAATVGRPLPNRVIDAINSHSEGNPFFVEEILKSLVEQDQLDTLVDQVQRGRPITQIAIPASIKDSVLTRMAGLAPTAVEVLRYAAVAGRTFDFDLLLRLTDSDETALLRAVEQLVTSQIVIEAPDVGEDHYRFRHALIREAIYDDMLRRERRIKHREVLRALEERSPTACECDVDQLAHHAYQARELPKAARYARSAAERAMRLYAYREAVNRYQLALELLESDDPGERAALWDELGLAASPLGDTAVAMRAWHEARRLYIEAGDRLGAGDVTRRLARVLWEREEVAAAFEALAEARAMLEAEPPSYALGMAYSAYSQLYMVLGKHQESLDWGAHALEIADALGDEIIQAHALNNMGCSLAGLGQGEQGIAHLERSLELSKKHAMLLDTVRAYLNLGSTLAGLGQIERARVVLSEGIAFASKFGLELYVGALLTKLGQIEMECGHWSEAEALALRATAIDRQAAGGGCYGVPLLAELRLRQGRFAEALQGLDHMLLEAEPEHQTYQAQSALAVLVRTHHALGDEGATRSYLERWHEIWQANGLINKLRAYAADAIEIALAAGREELAHSMLAQLATPIEAACDYAWLVPLPPEDAFGVAAAHTGRHQEAAEHFARAVALWHRREQPFWEGRSRRRRAWSLLQTGSSADREEALRELGLAHGIFATLGAAHELQQTDELIRRYGASRPARPHGRSDGLTPREQQVIALVARGYSNRAIAEALVISEKTAEVHVSNILGKLGFSSRAQAAAYAVERQMVER